MAVGSSDAVKERVRLLSDPESLYYKQAFALVTRLVAEERRAEEEKARRNRLVIESGLPADGLRFLEKMFGFQLSVQVGGTAFVSPWMEAFAKCMSKFVMDAKSWQNEELVLPGGDLKQVAVRVAPWMHVCRMPGTPVDTVRAMEENRFLARAAHGKNARMAVQARELLDQQKFDGGRGLNVCADGTECKHQCDTLVFNPQHCQVGAAQVAKLLIGHSAVRAKGWFFFSPKMLYEPTGWLFDRRVRYFVDGTRGLVSVFEGKSNHPFYVYDFIDVMSIIRHRSYTYEGHQFHVEMQGDMEGVMVWFVTKSEVVLDKVEEVDLPLWFRDDSFTRFSLCSFLTHVPGETAPQRLSIRANETLVEKAIARLVSREEKNITMAEARRAVRDFSDQYMENSGFVTLPEGVNGLVGEFLSRCVYRRAKYAKVAQMIAITMQDQRLDLEEVALRGTYAAGLAKMICMTGRSLMSVLMAPMNDVLAAGRTESWDVNIQPEDPWVVINCRWDPVARGRSPLGGVRNTARVDVVGRRVLTQAWEWYAKEKGDAVQREVEVERVTPRKALGVDRSGLVESLTLAYDASELERDTRLTTEFVKIKKPELTPVSVTEDPYSGMQEEFDENFPGLGTVDLEVRPFLVAEADRSYHCGVPSLKMKGSEAPPKDMEVLTTCLKSGGTGARPRSMAETMGAFGKRVGGAPDYQLPCNEDQEVKEWFDQVAAACFRDGWQDIVRKRVERGMGQPRVSSVIDSVSKLSPSNVAKVQTQRFSMAEIVMTEFSSMVKRQPKDKLALSTAFEHAPTQTIMYQPSKATNLLFSSLLGEFHDLLDDVLRKGLLVNPRRDKSYVEEVWNATKSSWECGPFEELQKVDVDITQCDKSHTGRNLSFYFYFLEQFGFGEMTQLWKLVAGMKTATATEMGLMIRFFFQVVSGLFATISMNSVIVFGATVVSMQLTKENLRTGVVTGDDVLAVIVGKERRQLQHMADSYVQRFNLEAKVFEPEVQYFCGRYVIEIDGYDFFIKDPERLYSALARSQALGYDADEAFEAFRDETEAYRWEELVRGVAVAVQKRQGRSVAPFAIARGIATLRTSKALFAARFVGRKKFYM